MNLLMIPLMIMSSLPNQIQIGPDNFLTGRKVTQGFVADQFYMAFTLSEFITLKSLVESSDGHCKEAIATSIGICHTQLEGCHETCNSIPDHQKNLIKSLKTDINILKADTRLVERQRDFYKYIAIGASVLAVSASGYIILK